MSRNESEWLLRLSRDHAFLLLGLTGAGKSSLINSFLYLANGKYKEEAGVGYQSKANTTEFARYSYSQDQQRAVAFLDTFGLPPWGGIEPLLTDFLHGRIRLGSDMQKIVGSLFLSKFDTDSYNWAKTVEPEKQRLNKPSAVLVVLDSTEALPESFLRSINAAVQKSGLPLFVIATRRDMLDEHRRSGQIREALEQRVKDLLSHRGLFFISNYLPHEDLRHYPFKKQKGLADAFMEIFQAAESPIGETEPDGKGHLSPSPDSLVEHYIGRKILLLGLPGSTMSSFINSFFYAVTGRYSERARAGQDEIDRPCLNVYSWFRPEGKATFIAPCQLNDYRCSLLLFRDVLDYFCHPEAYMKYLFPGQIYKTDVFEIGDDCSKGIDWCGREQVDEEGPSRLPSVVLIFVDPTIESSMEFAMEMKEAVDERFHGQPEKKVFFVETESDYNERLQRGDPQFIEDTELLRITNYRRTEDGSIRGGEGFMDVLKHIATFP